MKNAFNISTRSERQIPINKAKKANKVRRVDRRTNALQTVQPTDQQTEPVIEVLCRTSKKFSRHKRVQKQILTES